MRPRASPGPFLLESPNMQRAAAVGLASFLCGCAVAAPFVPTDDAQVLERLPDRSAPQYRDLKRLQASAAATPGDVASAVALANAYYRISRSEGDPRYL